MPRSIDIISFEELMGRSGEDRRSHPTLTLSTFHNALRILMNIDRAEFLTCLNQTDLQHFSSLDPKWPDRQWERFREQPHRYFIQACDYTAERLFAIVIRRSAR